MEDNNEKGQLNLEIMIQNEITHYYAIQTSLDQLRNDVEALVLGAHHVLTTGICRINLMGAPNQNLRAPHNQQQNNHKTVPIRIVYHPQNPANQWGEYWTIDFRPNADPTSAMARNHRLVVMKGNYHNPNHWAVMKYQGLNMIPALNRDGHPAVIEPNMEANILELCIASARQVAQMDQWFQSVVGGISMNTIFVRMQQIYTALEGLNVRVEALPRQQLHPLLEECDDRTIGANVEYNEINHQYMEFCRTIARIRQQQHTAVNATLSATLTTARDLY